MPTHPWHTDNPLNCPLVHALNVVGGKWKPVILHMLGDGTRRFGELRKGIPPVSHKMLTQQLRELEADGVIAREVFAEVPPRVEYRLTEVGHALSPVLASLYAWGEQARQTGATTREKT